MGQFARVLGSQACVNCPGGTYGRVDAEGRAANQTSDAAHCEYYARGRYSPPGASSCFANCQDNKEPNAFGQCVCTSRFYEDAEGTCVGSERGVRHDENVWCGVSGGEGTGATCVRVPACMRWE